MHPHAPWCPKTFYNDLKWFSEWKYVKTKSFWGCTFMHPHAPWCPKTFYNGLKWFSEWKYRKTKSFWVCTLMHPHAPWCPKTFYNDLKWFSEWKYRKTKSFWVCNFMHPHAPSGCKQYGANSKKTLFLHIFKLRNIWDHCRTFQDIRVHEGATSKRLYFYIFSLWKSFEIIIERFWTSGCMRVHEGAWGCTRVHEGAI